MAIKAVLFDLDGTLLDTAGDFEVVLNRLLAEENKPPLASAVIRSCVSNGARALINLGFDVDAGHPSYDALRQRLLDHYSQHLCHHTTPFPGIMELLQQIAHHKLSWAIVTNKPDTYTQPLLAALDLKPAPLAVVCPDHVTQTKPHPEPLLLACKKLGCKPHEAIYIGDHKRDIDGGRNAGMKTIAAAYGYVNSREEAESWKADYLVDRATAIWPLISQYL